MKKGIMIGILLFAVLGMHSVLYAAYNSDLTIVSHTTVIRTIPYRPVIKPQKKYSSDLKLVKKLPPRIIKPKPIVKLRPIYNSDLKLIEKLLPVTKPKPETAKHFLQFNVEQSSEFGPILIAKLAQHMFTNNAFMIEANAGAREHRLALTWGWQFKPQQRIKFTAERLAQYLDFTFDYGNTRNWVGQNAMGVGYQWLFYNSLIKAVDLSAYLAKAGSKFLPPIIRTIGGEQYANVRRIAGATSQGGQVAISLFPWTNALMKLGLNYDYVNYHNYFTRANQGGRLGIVFDLLQLINPNFKMDIGANTYKFGDEFDLSFTWIPQVYKNMLELGLTVSHKDNFYLANDNSIIANLNYRWGEKGKSNFHLPNFNLSFLNWVTKPAVHMQNVIAMADQVVTGHPTSSALANRWISFGEALAIDVASMFSPNGSGSLHFSIPNKPFWMTIGELTGIIGGTVPGSTADTNINVVATKYIQSYSTRLSTSQPLTLYVRPTIRTSTYIREVCGSASRNPIIFRAREEVGLEPHGGFYQYSVQDYSGNGDVSVDPDTGVVTFIDTDNADASVKVLLTKSPPGLAPVTVQSEIKIDINLLC